MSLNQHVPCVMKMQLILCLLCFEFVFAWFLVLWFLVLWFLAMQLSLELSWMPRWLPLE